MAILVTGLHTLERKFRRHVRSLLKTLDDSIVVRAPMMAQQQVAQLLLEMPERRWLFLSVNDQFSDPGEVARYDALSNELKAAFPSAPGIPLVHVCWNGSVRERDLFAPDSATGIVEVERDDLMSHGADLIGQHAVAVEPDVDDWLRGRLLAETEIPAAMTTRVLSHRDNRARLRPAFLDYDQEAAAKLELLDNQGPPDDAQYRVRLLNGVAGSGKTLIMIQRALLFCRHYPTRKVLALIHNKPVTLDVREKIEAHLGGLPDNLEVQTFHAFALAQVRRARQLRWVKVLFNQRDTAPVRDLINSQRGDVLRGLSTADLQDEIDYINDYLIAGKADYLEQRRQGRGFVLRREQREAVWELYEQVSARFGSPAQGYLPSLYIRELCLQAQPGTLAMFDKVLIDEAQFFAPSWFQLVLMSLNPGAQLYICADPNQGFLKHRLSWRSVGIEVRGRSLILNHSYRTTRAILSAATHWLDAWESRSRQHPGSDQQAFVYPDFARMVAGTPPWFIRCATAQDASARLLNEVIDLLQSERVPFRQILILTTEAYQPWQLARRLAQSIGEDRVRCYSDNRSGERNPDSVRIATLNSATGLEAGVVFILGVETIIGAMNNLQLSEDARDAAIDSAARRLYMAMTRAGQKLVLLSTADAPPELKAHVQFG